MTVETALYPTQLNTTLPTSSDFVSEGDDHLRLLKTVVKTTFPNLGGAWNATQTEANYIVGVTSPIQAQLDTKGAIAGQIWTGTHSFPSTTTVGPLTPAIQGHLSTVTSDVQAQLNARAIKAGDTYSGTHNYTGATINVPTLAPGSTGNGAASVDYANALSFAAALPGQAGNANKFVRTNGSTASWSDLVEVPIAINTNTAATVCRTYVFTASLTLTLPASPAHGGWVEAVNYSGTRTPVIARNGNNIQGIAEDMTVDITNAPIRLTFVSGTGWIIK